jgi:hypothetical protein
MKKLYFALLALLLLGCQSPKNQNKASTLDCFVPRNDEGTEDSIKEYYERMEQWKVLHGGMSRWESDK